MQSKLKQFKKDRLYAHDQECLNYLTDVIKKYRGDDLQ
jgi:hypothetical protein